MNRCRYYLEQSIFNPYSYSMKTIGRFRRDKHQCEGDLSKCRLYPEVRVKRRIATADKTISIQMDISKQALDNTDIIIINDVKYVKESK